MQKRIFIAINLPQELKNKILGWQKKWLALNEVEGIGWTKPDNLHITMVFIGEIEEYAVGRVLEATRGAAKNFKPFEIKIDRIHTRFAEAIARRVGPNLNMPRMIWFSGPENKNLSDLARQIRDGLEKQGIGLKNNHGFKIHITLARARNDELRGIKIDEKFNYSFLAESIEIMESKLSPSGPKYLIIKSIKL